MSAGPPPQDLPNPDEFKKFYGDWYNVIQTIAGGVVFSLGVLLTGIFGANFNDQHQVLVKVVGYGLTLALVAGGVWLWRARAPRPTSVPPVIRVSSTAAFRGLYAFSEDDLFDLPGAARRAEAATVFTQVQSPGFKFGLISGETGCGKSSFLASGVLRRLRAANIPVEIVRSPRALLNRVGAPPEGEQPGLAQLGRELEALQRRAAELIAKAGAAAAGGVVLLVDQLEEFLIDYPYPAQRRALGLALAGLLNGTPRVKILCAIRKDYVLDVRDFSDSIVEPLSAQSLTSLKNFTTAEASEVICEAAGIDGAVIKADFANRIAADLAERGFVRPPELQIVCTALHGRFEGTRYEELGGKQGILSDHVKNSLFGLDQTLGRRLLRELCDFTARAKKAPRPFDELFKALAAQPLGNAARLDDSLNKALAHLETARLVTGELRDGKRIYALAADYLVEAIAQATRDVSTGAEEAEHLLSYYQGEAAEKFRPRWWVFSDPVIPWSKLRFIKANADKASQRKPEVALLLARSTWRYYARTAGLGAAVVVSAIVLATPLTLQWSWRLEAVGHHWPAGLRGPIGMRPVQVGGQAYVASESLAVSGDAPLTEWLPQTMRSGPISSRPFSVKMQMSAEDFGPPMTAFLRLWSPQDGSRLGCASGRFWSNGRGGGSWSDGPAAWDGTSDLTLLQIRAQGSGAAPKILLRPLAALNTPPRETDLPPQAVGSKFGWTLGPRSVSNRHFYLTEVSGRTTQTHTLHAFALDENKEKGRLEITAPKGGLSSFQVHGLGGDRFALLLDFWETLPDRSSNTRELRLWELGQKDAPRLDSLEDRNFAFGTTFSIAVSPHPPTGMVVLLSGKSKDFKVRSWVPGRSAEASPTSERAVSPRFASATLVFSPDGKYLLFKKRAKETDALAVEVWEASTLQPSEFYSGRIEKAAENLRFLESQTGLVWLAWTESGKTKLWNLKGTPLTVNDLDLAVKGRVICLDAQKNGTTKALITDPGDKDGDRVEVWDLADGGKRLLSAVVPGGVYEAGFTIDGRGVYVKTEGGGITVFEAAKDGQKAELLGVGGDSHLVSYNPDEKRIIVWTSEGRVLRYHWTLTTWLSRLFPTRPETLNDGACEHDE